LGETPFPSIFSSLSYLRYGFLILAISFILEKNLYYLKYFFYISFFSLIFLFYDALLQFITNQNLLGTTNISSDRFTGFFGDEQILGSFSVRFLPIILFLVNFFYFRNNNFFFQNLFISLIIFLVLVSGERTAIFMLAIYIIFFIIISKKIKLAVTAGLAIAATYAGWHFWSKRQTEEKKFNVVFVLGGPGAGKGTNCAKIVENFDKYKGKHFSEGYYTTVVSKSSDGYYMENGKKKVLFKFRKKENKSFLSIPSCWAKF
jgi:membrane protein implicated in regulation of membrane protease activity